MSEQKPTYEELEQRCRQAEALLEAIRSGKVDTLGGDKAKLVLRLAEAEEREAHIKQVLLAIRDVNQLIVQEMDPSRLISQACDTLTSTLGYYNAWIALFNSKSGKVDLTASSGFDGQFDRIAEGLRSGEYPSCMSATLESGKTVVVDKPERDCKDCRLAEAYGGRTGFARSLQVDGNTYGIVAVSVPSQYAHDTEEIGLFEELAKDLAFGLHKIESARELESTQKLYRDTFDKNQAVKLLIEPGTGKIVEANNAACRFYGYTRDELTSLSIWDINALGEKETRQRMEQARSEEQIDFIFPHRLASGEIREVEVHSGPVQAGDHTLLHSIILDVTERRRAEDSLRESEHRLRNMFENAPIAMFEEDFSGVETWFESLKARGVSDLAAYFEENPNAISHAVGLVKVSAINSQTLEFFEAESARELLGLLGAHFPIESYPAFAKELCAIWKGAQTCEVEFSGKTFKGKTIQYLLRWSAPVLDGKRNLARAVVACVDITEQKQAQEAVRESERKYRTLFESAPIGIFTTTTDGSPVEVNPALARMLGFERPEQPLEYYSNLGVNLYTSAERRDEFVRAIREHGKVQNFEYQATTADDRTIWLSMNARLANEKGPSFIEGFTTDVTKRKLAEAERERLLWAIEQSGEVIVITDLKGHIEYANPAFEKTTGYTREEALGQNPRILKSGEQDESYYANLWRTILRGETWEGRFVNKRKNGSLYIEDANISPVRNEQGEITNFVAVKRDVTEQIRMSDEQAKLEERFQQSQKLESIGRLAGGVAHDLNNLLSPILGYSEMLLEDQNIDGDRRESLQEIAQAGIRARDLVRQLLAFSRKQLLEFKPLDLNEILLRFERLLRRTIREDVDIQVFTAPKLPPIMGDAGQLEQVIMNLAVNAQDAIHDVGTLTIETQVAELDEDYVRAHEGADPGTFVTLCVTDTGHGMDAETKASLFEPFFTTKAQEKGTGLGLATVYGIVKQHGGNIWVYSEPGKGATFKIYLPVAEHPSSPKDQATPKTRSDHGTETVLLVEDNDQVRNLAQAVLKRRGYTVIMASDGKEALELLEEYPERIHLLLTDVVMPEMSGRDLYKQIVTTRHDVKVLYMSGYTENVIAHRGVLDAGVNFIQKPFSVQALAAKVRAVLDAQVPGPRAE